MTTLTFLLGMSAALAGMMLLVSLMARRPVPKKLLAVFFGLTAAAIGLTIYEMEFKPFDRSGGETFMEPLDSPSGRYTASAFHRPYGGAAGGVTVWIEVSEDGGKPEIVYYAEANSRFLMQWTDDGRLSVTNEEPDYLDENRNVDLAVGKEVYHDTGKACGTLLVNWKYETCYQKMKREST